MDRWDQAINLLAVRLDTIGDVLMTTPALRALKQSVPGRRVTLLTSPSGAEAASLVPEIDAILVYEAPWMKATPPRATGREDLDWIDRLRCGQYDAAVIFNVYSQNPMPPAVLCYLADIPRRLAYCHENPYQILTHWVPDPEPARMLRHEVRRQLDLVATIGATTPDERMSLRVPPWARQRVTRLLDRIGLDRAIPWIVMHTGATAPSRRYPPEQFAEAGRRLAADVGCQIVLTGNSSECETVGQVRQMTGAACHNLAGQLALDELAALLELAPLLVSNNSGPVHVAAAVGTPVVDLYALTNPQHTPWGVPHRVLSYDVPCKYCYKSVCPEGHHDCLRRVRPEAIVDAVVDLLSKRGALEPVGKTAS